MVAVVAIAGCVAGVLGCPCCSAAVVARICVAVMVILVVVAHAIGFALSS